MFLVQICFKSTLKQDLLLRWLESPEFTLSTDFGILADVSIFETGLGRFRLVIFC